MAFMLCTTGFDALYVLKTFSTTLTSQTVTNVVHV